MKVIVIALGVTLTVITIAIGLLLLFRMLSALTAVEIETGKPPDDAQNTEEVENKNPDDLCK